MDQTGGEVGGAEESLALLLLHLPKDIAPVIILFQDGAFAQRLRDSGFVVEVVSIAGTINAATRSRIPIASLRVVPGALGALAALFRRHRIEVVHTNTVKAHFLGATAAWAAHVPCVMHLRDILSGIGRLALRATLATCCSRAIAISERVASCYGAANTEVIGNPLDLAAYDTLPPRDRARRELALPDDAPIFAIVGRVNRWKGHEKFLRAAARASKSSSLRFVVAGEPRFGDWNYLAELRELAASAGIASRVHFLPWQADMVALYAAIDVIVNCSEREPFGRTVIEAAAASVPAICFDDAGVAEFMSRAGVGSVVPAGDEAALADAMIRLGSDPEVLARSGRSARAWAQEFDAETHARKVATVLRAAARR